MPVIPGHTRLENSFTKSLLEAGCDEAGRGCLAGPVFAAAVILPADFYDPLIIDSKKLTAKQRTAMRKLIEKYAVSYGTGMIGPAEIDRVNILNASIRAMHLALDKLDPSPEFILVDGNCFRDYGNIPHRCVIRGDQRFLSVAAASILAKTSRDEYMSAAHDQYPQYGWLGNKGYPTLHHREALQAYGPSPLHRLTFRPSATS